MGLKKSTFKGDTIIHSSEQHELTILMFREMRQPVFALL